MAKSAPVVTPWFTICNKAPESATGLQAAIPKATKPMWLTLE